MLTRQHRWVPLAIVVHCALLVVGCRSTSAPRHPNVLLIVADALRADHLSAYGYPRPTSPNFDALAATGVLYLQAHTTTSWTNPSVASLFTGQRPRVLRAGAPEYIAADATTLAEAFHTAGYRTGAMVGNLFLAPEAGFAQGFDDYVPAAPWMRGPTEVVKQPAERLNALARAWLHTAPAGDARPWFLYVHYMDPHWPYEPPPETAQPFWRSADTPMATAMRPLNKKLREHDSDLTAREIEQSIDLYDGAIAHFDAHVAALLAELKQSGQLANTIVCITADHGEEFGDHGGFRHARTLYEEMLHVPLLIIGAGAVARVDRLVQTTQIGRTLLDAAGVPAAGFAGGSLDAEHAADSDGAWLAELAPWAGAIHQQALLRGSDKLIVTADAQRLLFNLREDPGERQNRSAEHPELVVQLGELLGQVAAHRQEPTNPPDPGLRERMRALGYDF